MGGAFGALGGDVSSFMVNPAGIGVYRSSEAVFSTGIYNSNGHTDYLGSKLFDGYTNLNIGNAGIVLNLSKNSNSGLRSFNIGIAYNRVNDFGMNTSLTGINTKSSIIDYFREQAYDNGLSTGDLRGEYFNSPVSWWRPMLAYGGGLLTPANSGDANKVYNVPLNNGDVVFQDQWTNVRGFNDLINLTFGGNVMDLVYFGGSFNITNINYHSSNLYSEEAEKNNTSTFNYLDYDQYYNAFGTGYSLSLGVILKPIQELRVGISYQSPTWTFIDDNYYAGMATNFNSNGEKTALSVSSYRVNTPQRITGSLAAVIGNVAILSADIDWVNYSNMKLRLKEDDRQSRDYESSINGVIGNDFRNTVNVRFGAEFKLTDAFAIRGGYQYYQNPYKDGIVTDHPAQYYNFGAGVNDAAGSGVNQPTDIYSAGFGYRTRSFYVDLAYTYTTLKNQYSLYDYYFNDGVNTPVDVYSGTVTQTLRKNAYIVTLGFKF
jgi:Long-chain fatty acid transport protein